MKSRTKTVEQVAGRLIERSHIVKARNDRAPSYPQLRANGSFFISEDFSLHTQFQNRWFLTKERNIIKFVDVKQYNANSFVIIGDVLQSSKELFNAVSDQENVLADEQLSSIDLQIFKVKCNVPTIRVEVPYRSMKCKFVHIFIPSRSLLQLTVTVIPQPDAIALFPLLHTFQDVNL